MVDAGGSGYLLLLDSFCRSSTGGPCRRRPAVTVPAYSGVTDALPEAGSEFEESGSGSDLRYEVMYFLEAPDHTMRAFKEVWAGIGDSIVVVGGDGLWNCHIHTNDVGASIEAALDAGRPRDIRVTDLADQVEEERWVREGAGAPSGASLPTPSHRRARPWWRWPTARASAASSGLSACTTSWPVVSR